jgi:hypothetical protein
LVYVDPPFFTQKTHSLMTRDRSTTFQFIDEWKSRAEYLDFLRARLKELHRVLKATGSLFFHCDTNASHHIRRLLDEVFGEAMFRSEIIWHYPTQKPMVLLERIIALVTSPGDLVLDPFCGSGTTLLAAQFLGRNSMGIDVSQAAVELTRQRLAQPVRTSSELLRKGRDSYVQSDEASLAYLCGLPFIPVQRNRGMDAILNANPGENPILIRVQRRGENLAEAADLLSAAGRSKQPATLVLVVTDPQQPLGLVNTLPPEVLLVNSTATELLERLADRGIVKILKGVKL